MRTGITVAPVRAATNPAPSYTFIKDPQIHRSITPAAIDPDGRMNLNGLRNDLQFFKERKLIQDPTITVEKIVDTTYAEAAVKELRATVLEPVRPSDFPDTLVPRLAFVQGLLALARRDDEQAEAGADRDERRRRRQLQRRQRRDSRTRGGERFG